jgi:fumarate hydratase class II
MADAPFRTERDTMGTLRVPADALWGASTQRAVENFPVSGLRMSRRFLRGLGLVKGAAARTNAALGRLDPVLGEAIAAAADAVAEGTHDAHFPVDVFQTGSGTSTNMNANEVIGRLAGAHPNDHVNLGQSSNDVIPTCLQVGSALAIREVLLPAIEGLEATFEAKSKETWEVVKTGRTHLQDATPIRLGQVFRGYAGQMARTRRRLAAALVELDELPLGGTAVGTGVNTHPEFATRVCALLSERLGFPVHETDNHPQAQATLDAALAASAAVRSAAMSLRKIADDVRWLASGPRCGLGEIALPEVQPGSSIMPGKVNPVIAESLLMACAHAVGADAVVALAAHGSQFELNTMLPLAAHHLVTATEILGAAAGNFDRRCARGIVATSRGPELVERSLMLATALVPHVGYDAAAAIAKEAAASGRTIRDVARERTTIPDAELATLLDPARMTEPQG